MNRKSPQDQSPTYLQRQSQAWCKVHKERVRGIIKQERLCLDAKLIYMGLLTYFHDGGGVLVESKDRVAKSLGFARERLDYCLDKLEQGGCLEIAESGAIFEPVVYKYVTGKEHPDDAENSRILQDLAKSGRILQNSSGETSPVEKSREFSGDPYPTKRTDTIEQKNRGNGTGAAPVPFPGLTETDLESVRDEFADLVFSDVYAKFLARAKHDGKKKVNLKYLRGFFELERKFLAKKAGVAVAASAGPASDPSEATSKTVDRKPEPVSTELPKLEYRDCPAHMKNEIGDYGKEIRKPFGWYIEGKKIADWGFVNSFVDQCRNMPAGTAEECREYLLSLTPKVKDWDTRDALLKFSGEDRYSLFAETNWDEGENGFEPTEWSGIETVEKEMEENERAASS